MDNITKEQRLVAIVLEHEDGVRGFCALDRVWEVMGRPRTKTLPECGKEMGFSFAECRGIMNGWDTVARGGALFDHDEDDAQYMAGYALGIRCAELVRERR